MGIRRYIIRRVLEIIPTVFAMMILTFVLVRLAPGDPALVMAGEHASLEFIDYVRETYGLTKPLHEQLLIYLQNVLSGNLGYSYFWMEPSTSIIIRYIGSTLLLTLSAQIVALVVGIVLGTICARNRFSKLDHALSFGASMLYSTPVFWVGMILILTFGVTLGLFPTMGMTTVGAEKTGIEGVLDLLWHLVLPVVTLASYYMPQYLRLTRAGIMEVMEENFIITFRAMGLSENTIFFKHALKNGILPTISMAGVWLSYLLTGAVLTETVFAWPGLGRMMFDAIAMRDYPLLMGIFLMASFVVTFVSLVIDVLIAVIDPRVAYK